jgi:hypothetical protein
VESLALDSTRRELVTYDDVIFPKPADSSAQVYQEFGRKYRNVIEEMLGSIKALDAPTDSEVRARMGGAASTVTGRIPNAAGAAAAADNPVLDAICYSRAQEISVYAHPTAFAWYAFWEKYQFAGENQALQDCWDSQIALWIYEDVVQTIQKMNGPASKVSDSAVKRLLGVSFSGPVVLQRRDSYRGVESMYDSTGTGGRDIPNYITPQLPSNFLQNSPTGRTCSEDVDIVHFAVSVLVDSRSGLSFVKELCSEKGHSYRVGFTAAGEAVNNARHNQITVLESDVSIVDLQSADHKMYRYGKSAVMQLDLVCEYQFYRKSYDMIKPEPIQQRLDLTAPQTGQ